MTNKMIRSDMVSLIIKSLTVQYNMCIFNQQEVMCIYTYPAVYLKMYGYWYMQL